MIDLAPLVPPFAALAFAAVSAAVPYLAPAARRYLHMNISATQAASIQSAADAGAKAAYGWLVANGASYAHVPMRNAAIATGVAHVLASVPDAVKAMGITPDHVAAMVSARLGGLLVTDPTVTVGAPAPANDAGAAAPEAAAVKAA